MSAAARTGLAAVLLAAALACLLAAAARAAYGPIELVSRGAAQQADAAAAPALSADGRYVAFQGQVGPEQGIFRADLETGAIVPVATGIAAQQGADASGTAPSISADGRYVAFTTVAPLDPGDDQGGGSSDVYVADMDQTPPRYELASAREGCDPLDPAPHVACGLSYGDGAGSAATGRVALSADGRRVVFFTRSTSDLTSGPGGSTEGTPTPARQVVLRDLDADASTLVSVERDPLSGAMTELPVPGGALISAVGVLTGAALSADGSTVAWLAGHVAAQAAMPAAEATKLESLPLPYDEPLWRRVADGPAAPIRRIVAGDGAADPFGDLTAKDTNLNSAQGWLGVAAVEGVPQLSADGRTVALIGNPAEATDVFVVDMAAGLSRAEAVQQLTREVVVFPAEPFRDVNLEANIPFNGHIYDLGISADGQRIAFTTGRQRSTISPPSLISEPPSSLGLLELYVIDRRRQTLQRVTHGTGGASEPSQAGSGLKASRGFGAASPSLAAGGRVAFASLATNLVAEDSNEASDVFLTESSEEAEREGLVELSELAAKPVETRPRGMTLTAFSLTDGGVRLVAVVPAAGRLIARAGTEREGGPGSRKVAAGRAWAAQSGPVQLELHLRPRERRLARRGDGLYATLAVVFKGAGGKTLRDTLQARFRVHAPRRGRR